jgi:hypothetical protein
LLTASCLSGCVVIQQISESQTGVGPVAVTIKFCSSSDDGAAMTARPVCRELGNPGDPTVDPTANDGASASTGPLGLNQMLFGFRLPTAATPPAALTINEAPGVSVLPSPSYSAALQALQPAPAGQRWAGYIASGSLTTQAALDAGTDPPSYTLRGAFANTGSPFRYRPVIGVRNLTHPTAGGPTRPVNCAEVTTNPGPNPGDPPVTSPTTTCIDSPSPAAGGVAPNRTFAARALSVVNGTPFSVKQGATTKPGFQVSAQGPPGYGTFALSVNATLPAAAPSITPITLSPTGPGRTSTKVAMTVPARTPLGTYTLSVKASSAGQTSTGSRTFTVTDGVAPKPRLKIARRLDRRGRLAVKVKCPLAESTRCAGSLVATSRARFPSGPRGAPRKLKLGKASFRVARGKTKTVRLKASPAAAAVLRAARVVKAQIQVTARDAADNSATRRVRYTARPH